jgi:hypothetical protein
MMGGVQRRFDDSRLSVSKLVTMIVVDVLYDIAGSFA